MVDMWQGHADSIIVATTRTASLWWEEGYCFTGWVSRDGVAHLQEMIFPAQEPWSERARMRAGNSLAFCPAGTVADLHTHPAFFPDPSRVDDRSWRERPYRIHMIAFPMVNGEVGLRMWVYPQGGVGAAVGLPVGALKLRTARWAGR